MARPSERDISQLGPWPLGALNVPREDSVPRAGARKIVNADVFDDGKIARRRGRTKVINATEPRSLMQLGRRMYFAVGTELYAVAADLEPAVVYSGLHPDAALAHCRIEPYLYVSDGRVALKVDGDGNVAPWAIAAPGTPSASVLVTGGLEPGRYLIKTTQADATGQESGASEQVLVTVEDGQGIQLALPARIGAAVRTMVYMSKPNGRDLLLAAAVPAVDTPATISITRQRLGRPLVTDDLDPMPAGQHAAYYNGRLYVMEGSILYWSEPNHYALTNIQFNHLPFAEVGTMVAAASEGSNGVFVGQENRTYFLRGASPDQAQFVEAYQAGVISHTLAYVPGSRLPLDNPPTAMVPMWVATNGVICVGLPNGEVLPLTEQRFVTAKAAKGAAMYRAQRGINQFLAVLENAEANNFAITDSVSAVVTRNGITI